MIAKLRHVFRRQSGPFLSSDITTPLSVYYKVESLKAPGPDNILIWRLRQYFRNTPHFALHWVEYMQNSTQFQNVEFMMPGNNVA